MLKGYMPEEVMDICILYVLYEARGIVFDCNDGRITGMHNEGREKDDWGK